MIRKTLGWALVSLTGLGLYMSWGNLYDLALACGMPPERAVVFPMVIDVVTVVAMLLALRGGLQSRSDRLYPWIALGLFGAATIGGNALHVLTAAPGAIVVNEWIAVVANSLPAVAMLLTTHMAAVTVYAPQKAEELADELTHEERVDKVAAVLSERDQAIADLYWAGESDRSIVEKLAGRYTVSRSTVARIRHRLIGAPTTEEVTA
jgi:hypothetical protein